MRSKTNPFLIRTIKEHSPYIAVIGLMLLLIGVSSGMFLQKISDINTNIVQAEKELADLKKKKRMIEYSNVLASKQVNIAKMNSVFSQLLPTKEDYFSIITALESISLKTNFIIDEYDINLKQTKEQRLSLVVVGHGDNQSFLNFLKEYQFSGGRLITIDEIKYDENLGDKIKLNLHFYTGGTTKASTLEAFSPRDLQTIEKIQSMTQEAPAQNDTQDISIFYETKTNPF